MSLNEQFSNRWGLILATLGMAVGAGNLWRFPRLAGQYGGSFLILWMFFLLVWSIPILMAEFSIGKKIKKGVIGSFAGLAGPKFTWMGFFIASCTLGITFYYSVVTAWGLQYLGLALSNLWNSWVGGLTLSGQLAQDGSFMESYWADVSNANAITLILNVLAIFLGIFFLYRGVQKGLELANKILIPSLFVLLILVAILALTIGNGIKGLEYMYEVELHHFSNPTVWLEALSQSAWSTGAGWGLVMTLSSYSRKKEDVTLNTFIGGFGNNTASLLSGMAILPAVFALAPSEAEAIAFLKSGNFALTFTIIPKLFAQIAGGPYLTVLFFVAFFMAAFSSLLTMLEMFIKILGDLGLTRHRSAIIAGLVCVVMGFPSAYSLDFFSNQDWVWGLGLIISGLFIIFTTLKYGVRSFKAELIDQDSDFKISTRYFSICMVVNLFLGIFLIYWWMSKDYDPYPWFNAEGKWNLWSIYSNATILTQWGVILIIGIVFNSYLYKKFAK